jgi:hypothetical protein
MIIKGSGRSGGKQLGLHLLKRDENEHVEIHEVSGFLLTQPLRIRPDICRVLDEEDDRCARADLPSSRSF